MSLEDSRKLFNNIPIGVYRTTPDGEIIGVNPALARIALGDLYRKIGRHVEAAR